jgi:tousled-like kinase
MHFLVDILSVINILFRQQERIAQEREDIEKQRKILQKKKPAMGDSQEKKRAKKDTDGFIKPAEKNVYVFCNNVFTS